MPTLFRMNHRHKILSCLFAYLQQEIKKLFIFSSKWLRKDVTLGKRKQKIQLFLAGACYKDDPKLSSQPFLANCLCAAATRAQVLKGLPINVSLQMSNPLFQVHLAGEKWGMPVPCFPKEPDLFPTLWSSWCLLKLMGSDKDRRTIPNLESNGEQLPRMTCSSLQ